MEGIVSFLYSYVLLTLAVIRKLKKKNRIVARSFLFKFKRSFFPNYPALTQPFP